MTPCLVLVDLQHDYLRGAGLEPAAGEIVDRAAALLWGCRAANIPVAHVWTTVSRRDDQRMPHWKRLGRWHCVEGTPGHKPPASLRPEKSEPVVHKRFFSAFSSGRLAAILKTRRVDTLMVAGIHLHACIRETVLDAYEQGFDIWVADDAVGSDDPLHAAITRRYLQSRAARFAPVAELLEMLKGEVTPARSQGKSASKVGRAVVSDPGGGAKSIATATLGAHAAGPTWATSKPAQRQELLQRLAVLLKQNAQPFAEQMAREIGKPILYGKTEVERTVDLLREIARQDLHVQETATASAMRRRAVGVIAVITPWNNPFLIPFGKIAAALFYGNTVVWKPAPAAALLAETVMKCLQDAGCTEGLVHVIHGDQLCAADLMSDPRVEAVTITGGLQAGRCAEEICARRHIPLQAELGGNNAAIIWPDCDLSNAATRIAEGAFDQAGQRCTANRRVIVHEKVYPKFLDLLARAAAAMPWGDPLQAATRIGPLVHEKQRERVASSVERATQNGLRIIVPQGSSDLPSNKPQSDGAYYPPTIVCCDDPGHEIVQEETFGPVLVVQRAANWAQAIELCNGVRQGLVAAIFTCDEARQQRFLAEAQAGVLKINQATADVAVHLPFGGWKASGVGPPEHGAADQEFYTRIQTIYRPGPAALILSTCLHEHR